MKSELYNQIYKCRMCGREFCPVTTCGTEKTLEMMDNFLGRANGASNEMIYLAPKPYIMHRCQTGDIGVADFIGYRKQVMEDE